MKRLQAAVAAFCLALAALSGCTRRVTGVTLCDPSEAVLRGWSVEVSEADVDRQILLLRSRYSTLSARSGGARLYDYLVLDYSCTVDGATVDAFSETDAEAVLGSGAFPEGFEEALLGVREGETREITLVFPDPYPAAMEYAGKTATFTVSVKEVDEQTFRTWDDAEVARITEYATVSELREAIRETVGETNRTRLNRYLREQMWNYISENSTVEVISAADVAEREAEAVAYFEALAASAGQSLGDYVVSLGYASEAAFREQAAADAAEDVRDEVLLKALAAQYRISVSDSEYTAGAGAYAEELGLSGLEALELLYDSEEIRQTLLRDKAELLLAARARLVDYTTGEALDYEIVTGTTVSWQAYVYVGVAGAIGLTIAVLCFLPGKKGKTAPTAGKSKRK